MYKRFEHTAIFIGVPRLGSNSECTGSVRMARTSWNIVAGLIEGKSRAAKPHVYPNAQDTSRSIVRSHGLHGLEDE